MNKKKILFLSNHFLTLYSFRKELLERLSLEDYEVYISTPMDNQNEYFAKLGFTIVETKIDRRSVNPIKDLSLIRQYIKIMKNLKPDIVFTFTVKPNIYGALASNILHIKQVCNITGTGGTFLNDTLLSKIVKVLYKLSVKKCYKVFFQNTGDRDFFIKNKMIHNNWELLPGSGVNLNQYRVTDFPSDTPISFIFIGRVMKLKGVDEFLEAAKYIKSKYANTKFYIAGWNEEEEYVLKVKEYEKDDYVEYLGFQKNISDWIQKCQCTVLPSHGGEGVPNVLLETAASGRVCIASSVNGSKDVIENEITGFIFDVYSIKSLVQVLEKYINLSGHTRANMGLAARKKVEVEFDRKIVIQKYFDEITATN